MKPSHLRDSLSFYTIPTPYTLAVGYVLTGLALRRRSYADHESLG